MKPLRVLFLLDRPELCGGVLNVGRIAVLLAEEGMDVIFSAEGEAPDWFDWPGAWHDHKGFRVPPPEADVYICTYWTTVRWAAEVGLQPRIHYCQGYEGDLVHLADELPAIKDVYRLPDPLWVVSGMLTDRLRDFERSAQVIPPVPAEGIRPRFRWSPRKVPRILIPGIFEAEVKNVSTALQAINLLRARGRQVEVHRLSTWPCSDEERAVCAPDVYHHQLPPGEVFRLLPTLDLLLFPSRHMEGFGLPVLEASLAGVPSVISRIPSLTCFEQAGMPAVDPEDPEAFADAVEQTVFTRRKWREQRKKALCTSRTFTSARTRDALLTSLKDLGCTGKES